MNRLKSGKLSLSLVLPLLLCVAVLMVSGIAFAFFTADKANSPYLNVGKIELSADTNLGVQGSIHNVMASTPLTNEISFSKSSTSNPMFVRAKISFSFPNELSINEKAEMSDVIKALRHSSNYNINQNVQNGAKWSNKIGNYIYLLAEDQTSFFAVNDNTTYLLSSGVFTNDELEFNLTEAQQNININMHVEFQAVQAIGLEWTTISDITNYFNTTFVEPSVENYNEQFQAEYTISSNNLEMGTVSLSNTESVLTRVFNEGETVTLYATANEDYSFYGWSSSVGETIISENAIYSFNVDLFGNKNFVGNFKRNGYMATANATNYGNVSIEGNSIGDNLFAVGDTIKIAAKANENYEFYGWSDSPTGDIITIENPVIHTVTEQNASNIFAIFVPSEKDYVAAGDYLLEVVENSSLAKIKLYNGNERDLVIPSTMVADNGVTYDIYGISGVDKNLDEINFETNYMTEQYYVYQAMDMHTPFYGCGIQSIVLPESCIYIGDMAFANVETLRSVTLAENTSYVGSYIMFNTFFIKFEDGGYGKSFIEDSYLPAVNGDLPYSNLYCDVTDDNLYSIYIKDSTGTPVALVLTHCTNINSQQFDLQILETTKFISCKLKKYDSWNFNSITIPESVICTNYQMFKGDRGNKFTLNLSSHMSAMIDSADFIDFNFTDVIDQYSYYFVDNNVNYYKAFNDFILINVNAEFNQSSLVILDGVTKIAEKAFYSGNANNLINITLPNTVKWIGNYAFGYNGNKFVNIPESIEYIGNYIYNGLSSSSYISLIDGANTFKYLTSDGTETGVKTVLIKTDIRSSVTLDERYLAGVKVILDLSSSNSANVTIESLYDVVCLNINHSIRNNFTSTIDYSNTKLKYILGEGLSGENYLLVGNVQLPSTIKLIDYKSFGGYGHNNNILSYTLLEDNIDLIPYFKGFAQSSSNGYKVNVIPNSVDSKITILDDGSIIYDSPIYGPTLVWVPFKNNLNSEINSYTIPSQVKRIENNLFENRVNLNSISFNDGLTTIGASAFKNCMSLRNIILPSTVKNIGTYAFMSCSSLDSIRFSDNIKVLKTGVMGSCNQLSSVILPNSLEYYVDNYSNSSSTYSVLYERRYNSFGSAFGNLNNENSLFTYDSNASIIYYNITPTDKIIIKCGVSGSYISNYVMDNSVKYISKMNFQEVNFMGSITLSQNLVSMGYQSFYNCTGMGNVILPESLVKVSKAVFDQSSMDSLTISGGLETISERAFANIQQLQSVNILNGVKYIKKEAFANCRNLSRITLSDTCEELGDSVLQGTYIIDSIKNYVSSQSEASNNNLNFQSFSNTSGFGVYIKNQSGQSVALLKAYVSSGTVLDSDFPNTLKFILYGSFRFDSCQSLSLPSSVVYIDQYAFNNGGTVYNLNIPSGIKNLNMNTFQNISYNLRGITITGDTTNSSYNVANNILYGNTEGNIFSRNVEGVFVLVCANYDSDGNQRTNFIIPEGVEYIPSSSNILQNAASISLPSTLKEFDPLETLNLQSMTIAAGNENYGISEDGTILYTKYSFELWGSSYPSGQIAMICIKNSDGSYKNSLTIPQEVVGLMPNFYVYTLSQYLTSITISSSFDVSNIYNDAGQLFNYIRTIYVLDQSATSKLYTDPTNKHLIIRDFVFLDYDGTKNVQFGPYDTLVFTCKYDSNGNNITSLVIPEGVEYVKLGSSFNNIQSLTIPSSVINMSRDFVNQFNNFYTTGDPNQSNYLATSNNLGLIKKQYIYNQYVGSGYVSSLHNNALIAYARYDSYGNILTSIVVQDGVESMFIDTSSVQSLTIPSTLKYWNNYENAYNLRTLSISGNVAESHFKVSNDGTHVWAKSCMIDGSIYENVAFMMIRNSSGNYPTSLTIDNGVEALYFRNGAYNITSLTIPSTLKNWVYFDNYSSLNAFAVTGDTSSSNYNLSQDGKSIWAKQQTIENVNYENVVILVLDNNYSSLIFDEGIENLFLNNTSNLNSLTIPSTLKYWRNTSNILNSYNFRYLNQTGNNANSMIKLTADGKGLIISNYSYYDSNIGRDVIAEKALVWICYDSITNDRYSDIIVDEGVTDILLDSNSYLYLNSITIPSTLRNWLNLINYNNLRIVNASGDSSSAFYHLSQDGKSIWANSYKYYNKNYNNAVIKVFQDSNGNYPTSITIDEGVNTLLLDNNSEYYDLNSLTIPSTLNYWHNMSSYYNLRSLNVTNPNDAFYHVSQDGKALWVNSFEYENETYTNAVIKVFQDSNGNYPTSLTIDEGVNTLLLYNGEYYNLTSLTVPSTLNYWHNMSSYYNLRSFNVTNPNDAFYHLSQDGKSIWANSYEYNNETYTNAMFMILREEGGSQSDSLTIDPNIENVVIGDSLSYLRTITMPASIKYFYNFLDLSNVYQINLTGQTEDSNLRYSTDGKTIIAREFNSVDNGNNAVIYIAKESQDVCYTSIIIDEGVESIVINAWNDQASALTSITIPSTLNYWAYLSSYYSALESINQSGVVDENTKFVVENNCIIIRDYDDDSFNGVTYLAKIIKPTTNGTTITIPNYVEVCKLNDIVNNFSNTVNFEIPYSIKYIGEGIYSNNFLNIKFYGTQSETDRYSMSSDERYVIDNKYLHPRNVYYKSLYYINKFDNSGNLYTDYAIPNEVEIFDMNKLTYENGVDHINTLSISNNLKEINFYWGGNNGISKTINTNFSDYNDAISKCNGWGNLADNAYQYGWVINYNQTL